MGIHGQTPNKTHQENDTKNPRKMQSAKKITQKLKTMTPQETGTIYGKPANS